jgi:hypothetical protein
MPEEGVETQELKEKLEEMQEHVGGHEHEGHEGRHSSRWTLWLSLSTALVAVLAAIASLESGAWANEAIIQKNDAVLHQSKADDAWSRYQAMAVKAVVYATGAEGATSPELARKWKSESEREKNDQKDVRADAEREEAFVERVNGISEHALHVHHEFAKSVTIFQVAIALAAIAALTRRKPMWWLSLVVGAAGCAFFVLGLVA